MPLDIDFVSNFLGSDHRRTPFSYSFFVGLVFCDSVQIRLNVAIQNEVCIGQRVVVDEIVQLRPLEAVVPSVKRSSTQAVSILNAQLMGFFMGISS